MRQAFAASVQIVVLASDKAEAMMRLRGALLQSTNHFQGPILDWRYLPNNKDPNPHLTPLQVEDRYVIGDAFLDASTTNILHGMVEHVQYEFDMRSCTIRLKYDETLRPGGATFTMKAGVYGPELGVDGYCDHFNSPEVALIDFHRMNEHPKVYIWSDHRSEEWTHMVSLHLALASTFQGVGDSSSPGPT